MKRMNSKGKLRLSKETLQTLQGATLDEINGGVRYTGCDSACTQCGGTKPPHPRPQDPLGPRSGVICGVDTIGNGGTPR